MMFDVPGQIRISYFFSDAFRVNDKTKKKVPYFRYTLIPIFFIATFFFYAFANSLLFLNYFVKKRILLKYLTFHRMI